MLGSRANALPSNIELGSGALLGANVKASPRESQFLAGAISLPAAWSESSARRACALAALAQQRQVQCAAVERRRLDRARERERERAPVVRRPLPNDPLPKPTLTWFMGFWKRRAPALRASLLHAAPLRHAPPGYVVCCAVLCAAAPLPRARLSMCSLFMFAAPTPMMLALYIHCSRLDRCRAIFTLDESSDYLYRQRAIVARPVWK